MSKLRTILHLDMDAFFASIEQRDHPEYRGKPVIVGGTAESRGVVSTCSYEARIYGVHSAMPTIQAKRLCPNGIFLPGNRSRYTEVSRQMFTILRRYTPVIEPLSIDEAFMDVSGCEKLFGDGLTIAKKLKADIEQELNLTASVGISYNKFLAKLASDLEKPNGIVSILPQDLERVVFPLPVGRLWGIGKKSTEQLMRLGLRTIGDVAKMDVTRVRTYIGNLADHIYALSHGLDDRPVQERGEAKSIGQETTFSTDVTDQKHLETTLLAQIESITRRLRAHQMECRTVTLKIRYAPFRTITKSHTLPTPTALDMVLFNTAKHLLQKCSLSMDDAIRLIGISVSHFSSAEYTEQLSFFTEELNTAKQSQLAKTIDVLKDKFGEQAIQRARLITRKTDPNSK